VHHALSPADAGTSALESETLAKDEEHPRGQASPGPALA
jgi:hypothetical protein